LTASSEVATGQPFTDDEMARTARWLAQEHLDLSPAALEAADLKVDEVAASAVVLADVSRMVRAVPAAMREPMESAIAGQVESVAQPHYQRVTRALFATGALDALEAERHLALRNARTEWLPALDAELLRRAGYAEPQTALANAVATARAMPDRMPPGATLESVIAEGEAALGGTWQSQFQPGPSPRPAKRWTGLGKILAGASLSGGNLAGGIALALGTLGASVGATWLGVVGSTGMGVGMIFEGVGALRGD
jgi:hypothetical protein